jgi:D-tyrosyl-tRNA(Tyr) deacylase
MRALLQRVAGCSVRVGDKEISRIGPGLLALLGVAGDDGEKDVAFIASKVAGLRIFDDNEGNMNLSLTDVGGELMVVSQFTLYADTRKGRRPSYVCAAGREHGEQLYEAVCEAFSRLGFRPAKGVFGAHMLVTIENDGPVTILLDSRTTGSDWA